MDEHEEGIVVGRPSRRPPREDRPWRWEVTTGPWAGRTGWAATEDDAWRLARDRFERPFRREVSEGFVKKGPATDGPNNYVRADFISLEDDQVDRVREQAIALAGRCTKPGEAIVQQALQGIAEAAALLLEHGKPTHALVRVATFRDDSLMHERDELGHAAAFSLSYTSDPDPDVAFFWRTIATGFVKAIKMVERDRDPTKAPGG